MFDFIQQYEATIRLSVFLGGFSLLALWEWGKPKRELTQVKIKRWLNNIALVVCSTIVVRIIVPTAAVGIAILAEQNQWGFVNYIELPFALKVLFSFILLDMAIYFQHAMFHVLPIMWRFHRVHHSDLDFDVTTGLRFHPIEIVISILFKLLLVMAIGAPVLAVILFEIVLNFMSMFTHSNISLNKTFERVLRWFFVTPNMHRVHHSVLENETNSNFSFNFSIWDRIFGTYLAEPQAGQLGVTIGLDQYREPKWQGLKGLIAMPFNQAIRGYTINDRDTLNADELSRVNELAEQQTKSLREAHEISEKKNQTLKKVVSRLTESEHYQSMLIENMIDGFISIDQKGVIDSFNPAAEKIFGYKANEVIGQNVAILMSDSEATHHDTHLSAYKEKGKQHAIGISRDIEGKHKDGSLFPLDIALSEVEIRGRKMYSAILRDISERKKAEEELLLAKYYAEKANLAKTKFLSLMSHELRTPLNAIIGFSELLSDQSVDDPMLHEQLDIITNAGHELLEKVNNVLALSHIDEGNINIVIEPFSLNELLEECHDLMKPLLDKKGVQLNFELNSNSIIIGAAHAQLKQVLLNLLSNAVKYNKEGGDVNVIVSDYDTQGLRIMVSDNGAGIEQSQLDKVFEPFNRLGWINSNIAGTGLGLTISKSLVELMGGTLEVESKLGEGSKFWIDLPNARSE